MTSLTRTRFCVNVTGSVLRGDGSRPWGWCSMKTVLQKRTYSLVLGLVKELWWWTVNASVISAPPHDLRFSFQVAPLVCFIICWCPGNFPNSSSSSDPQTLAPDNSSGTKTFQITCPELLLLTMLRGTWWVWGGKTSSCVFRAQTWLQFSALNSDKSV